MLDIWTAFDEDGKWVHHRNGLSLPRQAGKSVVAILWVAFLVVVMGYKVLWTDHNYATTCEMLSRFRKIFGHHQNDTRGVRSINKRIVGSSSKTAQEYFEFDSGGVLAFSTRTKSSSLGFSFDIIVLDEAQELMPEHLQAILPTTSAGLHQNSQFLYLGSPTRAGSNATSFKSLRDEALGGSPGEDLSWVEWGADEVGDVLDTSRLYDVNPSLHEGRADIAAIVAGIRGLLPDDLAAAQEYFGYWLPPADKANAVISTEEWDACATGEAPVGKASAFGAKFSADGSCAAIAVAVCCGDVTHVELVEMRSVKHGTRWLADAIRKNADTVWIIDGKSGAQALRERVSDDVDDSLLITPSPGDVISAASGFVDGLRERTIVHYQSPGMENDMLTASATSSPKRLIGTGGGWGFGGENPTPVEAAALAAWGARNVSAQEEDDMEVYF